MPAGGNRLLACLGILAAENRRINVMTDSIVNRILIASPIAVISILCFWGAVRLRAFKKRKGLKNFKDIWKWAMDGGWRKL
jgi:hypothetical protein